jgi:tetratricopeptide (TPR) repeat protein
MDNNEQDEASALLERAAEDAHHHPEIRADLLARLARAYMRQTRDEDAVSAADRAIVIAEPLRLDRIVAEAFVNKGSAMMKLGRLHEPRMLLRAGMELAHEAGDVDLELRARANLSVLLSLHVWDQAEAIRRDAIELARRVGSYKYAAYLADQSASQQGERGVDWDRGIAELDALLAEATEPRARSSLLAHRYWFEVNRGQDGQEIWSQLEHYRSEGWEDESLGFAAVSRARGELMDGRPTAALATIRQALPALGQIRSLGYWELLAIGAARRDIELVREAVAGLEDEGMITNVYVALRAAATGTLAALEDRTEDAVASFATAVERFQAAGWLYLVAFVQRLALELLPREPAFEGWADEARDRFELLGAKPDLRLLDEALAQAPSTLADRIQTGVGGGR